jgi:hypothetical protein
MKSIRASGLVLLCLSLLLGSTSCAKQTEPNPPEPLSTAEVVAKVNPSVVQIVTADGTGSGIILDADGHVLTNNHVIEKAASANVVLSDGRTLSAQVFNRDWTMDLAVLKVTASDLQPATLGSSSEVQLGEDVIALGYPLDLGSSVTVTKGIVSAFRQLYVQTDAPVNPGNSGGPLVNMWGEVIGLVTAKPSIQEQEPVEGIGFAIPVDQIKDTLTSLLSPQELSSLAAYRTVTDAPGTPTDGLLATDVWGNIHYVWEEMIQDYSSGTAKLMYSVRSAGGNWSTPEIIVGGLPGGSGPIHDSPQSFRPQGIAIDQDGTVNVVWQLHYEQWAMYWSTSICALFHASKRVGEDWSSSTNLCNVRLFSTASFAADSAGNLHLVCEEVSYGSSDSTSRIFYLQKPKEGAWSGQPLVEGIQDHESLLSLTCDSKGNLLLAYYSNSRIYSARKPASAPWTTPSLVPESQQASQPQTLLDQPKTVVDTEDTIHLAFQCQQPMRIAYISSLADQSWSAIQYLSGAEHLCSCFLLTGDASGTVYAVWKRFPNPEDAGSASLVLRYKTPGNPWSSERLIYETTGGLWVGAFVVDRMGTAHLLVAEQGFRYVTLAISQAMN